MPNKELQTYYNYLKANGADVPPTINSFETTLSDSASASQYYTYLKDNGFDVPETLDSFTTTFGLKKKENTDVTTSDGSTSVSESQKTNSPLLLADQTKGVNDQFNKIALRGDVPVSEVTNVSVYPSQKNGETDVEHVKKVARQLSDNFVPSYAKNFVNSKIDKATPLQVEAEVDKQKSEKDNSAYDNYKKNQSITSFNDRMVNGDLTEEDFNVVSQFVPKEAMPSLKSSWNNNMRQTKEVVDGYLQNNVEKLNQLKTGIEGQISSLDNQIAEIDDSSQMLSPDQKLQKSALQEQRTSLQGKLDIGNNLIQKRAEEKLDAIGDGLLKSGALGMFTDKKGSKVGKSYTYDEYGLLSDEAKQTIQTNVESFIANADPQTKYLLQQYGGTDREKLNDRVYQIARNKIEYEYPAKQKTLSEISETLKTKPKQFQELANTILGYRDEENVKNTAEKFKMVGGANFMELQHSVGQSNNELNNFIKTIQSSSGELKAKFDELDASYNNQEISKEEYQKKRIEVLRDNPQTQSFYNRYAQSITQAQAKVQSNLNNFVEQNKVDLSKYISEDKNGNILFGGMEPTKAVQELFRIDGKYAKNYADNAAKIQSGKESKGNDVFETARVLSGFGDIGASFNVGLNNGTNNLANSMFTWVYDNTGIDNFGEFAKIAQSKAETSNLINESDFGKEHFGESEQGDFSKLLDPYYIAKTTGESLPMQVPIMALTFATDGIINAALLRGGALGLSEGVGEALALTRAGRNVSRFAMGTVNAMGDAELTQQQNYIDLVAKGMPKEEAAKVVQKGFWNELPLDIATGIFEFESLAGATSRLTFKNAVKKAGTVVAESAIGEPIQEVGQAYSLEAAQNKNSNIVDYLGTKDAFNNALGAMAGSLGQGGSTAIFSTAKNAIAWNRLYNISSSEMRDAVRSMALSQQVRNGIITEQQTGKPAVDIQLTALSAKAADARIVIISQSSTDEEKQKASKDLKDARQAHDYITTYRDELNNIGYDGSSDLPVTTDFKLHNKALAASYEQALERENKKTEPNKQKVKELSKFADFYNGVVDNIDRGKTTPIYALNTKQGRVFISENTAKTLAQGNRNDAFEASVKSGDITGIDVVNDNETFKALDKKLKDNQQATVTNNSQQQNAEPIEVTNTESITSNGQNQVQGTPETSTEAVTNNNQTQNAEVVIPSRTNDLVNKTFTDEEKVKYATLDPESPEAKQMVKDKRKALATTALEEFNKKAEVGSSPISENQNSQEATTETAPSEISSFADRMAKGEKMTTPEDLQFYENNKSEIEKSLTEKAKSEPTPTNSNPVLKDVESTTKALQEIAKNRIPFTFTSIDEFGNTKTIELNKGISEDNNGFKVRDEEGGSYISINSISKQYHQAKANGSNPELVKAVESLLSKEQAPPASDVEFTAKGGNKVVDEKGSPLVLYHGTSKGLQAKDLKQSGQAGDYGEGIYFATDKREAEQRNAENIIEANVKSDKHLVIGSKEYFDGIYKTLEKKYGSVIPQYAIGAEAKKAGYTSIEVERPEGKWIIAFDGAKIKDKSTTQEVKVVGSGVGGDVVKEPKAYAEATDAYKATELGSSEDAKSKKQALVEQAETEEGKKFVESEVSKLEKNDDGTITVFRSGTLQDGHNPATTSRKTAEIIAAERKKQGLSSDIVEVRVNPSDISVVVKGIESEVFVKVDKNNRERIEQNTTQKQKTKTELLAEKDDVQKELGKTRKALSDSEKAFSDGTYPFSENVFKDANKKQKAKIKNLEWQLSKIDKAVEQSLPTQEVNTNEPIASSVNVVDTPSAEKKSASNEPIVGGDIDLTKAEYKLRHPQRNKLVFVDPDIISELNKLSTSEEKLNWLKEKGLITPITVDGKEYNAIDYSDRVMVLVKIGKYNVPFYISTGQAGKKNVKAGNWYVVFGIGESGWINKGSEELINKQYDFPVFQKFAKILNEGVGNIQSRENDGNGKMKSGIGFMNFGISDINQFNSQMNLPITPAKNNTDSKTFYENVNKVIELVNGELKNVSAMLLDRLSKDDPNYDVQNKKNQIGSRVQKAKDFILNYAKDNRWINPKTGERSESSKAEFEPSIVQINNGKISFEDGRHRILAAKELGISKVAVEVPRSQAESFEKEFNKSEQQVTNKNSDTWSVGDILPSHNNSPEKVIKSIDREAGNMLVVTFEDGTRGGIEKNKGKYLSNSDKYKEQNKSESESSNLPNTLSGIYNKYNNGDDVNASFSDFVSDVETYAKENQDKVLLAAVDSYKREQEYDYSVSGRGDMQTAEQDFENIVKSQLNKKVTNKNSDENKQRNNIDANGNILNKPTNKEELAEIEKEIADFEKELDEQDKQVGISKNVLPISDIIVNPGVFQFKTQDEDNGVNRYEKLEGKYDRNIGGSIGVWVDEKNELGKGKGKVYVVDGHHRMDLAKRSGEKNIDVFYIEAPTSKEARLIGAKSNIAQGRGTAIDAAKIYRDATPSQLENFVPKSKVGKEGKELSKLTQSIFDLVAQEKLDIQKAIAISQVEESKQELFYKAIKRIESSGSIKMTPKGLMVMAEKINSGDVATNKVKQVDLFGTSEQDELLLAEQSQLEADIKDDLSRDSRILGNANKNKEVLERAKNVVDVEGNAKLADESKKASALYDTYKKRSSVAGIIMKATEDLSKAKDRKLKQSIREKASEDVKNAIQIELNNDFGNASPKLMAASDAILKAQAAFQSAKRAYDQKRKEVYGNVVDDALDLFGERKSVANTLFGADLGQVESSAVQSILAPFKAKMDNARAALEKANRDAQSQGSLFQYSPKNIATITEEAFDKLVGKLKKAFPNTRVFFDESEMKAKLVKSGTPQNLVNKLGEVYGVKFPDGSIYLNRSKLNANSPIHEFSHLWEQLNPKSWKEGIELIKGTRDGRAIFQSIKSQPAYSGKTDNEIWSEALNTLIGYKGESKINNPALLKRFKEWVVRFFKSLGDKLGIRNLTSDDKLQDFTSKVLGDLLGGKPVVNQVSAQPLGIPELKASVEGGLPLFMAMSNDEIQNRFPDLDVDIVEKIKVAATNNSIRDGFKDMMGKLVDMGAFEQTEADQAIELFDSLRAEIEDDKKTPINEQPVEEIAAGGDIPNNPPPPPKNKSTDNPSSDNEFIARVFDRTIDSLGFPSLINLETGELLKQETAKTQGEVQGRDVLGDYVKLELATLKEIGVENVRVFQDKFGNDWMDKVASFMENEPYRGNVALKIGVLAAMSEKLNFEIDTTSDLDVKNKLYQLQDRIDAITNLQARQTSLGLTSRRLLRDFATGKPLTQYLDTHIVSKETSELVESINSALSKVHTDEELNNAPPLPPTKPKPQPTKSQQAKKQSNKDLKDALSQKSQKTGFRDNSNGVNVKKSGVSLLKDAVSKIKEISKKGKC